MQRWQLTFSRGEELRYVAHLDLMRAWERALRRAGIPLAYSQGFRPHPKLSFAAPLPVGILGAAELLDVSVDEDLAADVLRTRLAPQLPPGLTLVGAALLDGPPLAARLRFAVYRVQVTTALSCAEIGERVATLLSTATLPCTRRTEKKVRHYDLRPLIADLAVEQWDGDRVLAMRLRAVEAGTGRPDEVLAALGLADLPARIERTALILSS